MSKTTKKRNKYNDIVVKRLAEKFGLTAHYIRMCLRGDRVCETADTIVKEYKALDKKVKETLNQ